MKDRALTVDTDAAWSDKPAISIVVACYNDALRIDSFFAALHESMQGLGRSYEIVFVNDGSSDTTWDCISRLFDDFPSITVAVDLMRNVGQIRAVSAGLVHVRGRRIVLIDSDMQYDPNDIPRLFEKAEQGYDLVSGRRIKRQDRAGRKMASKVVNFILRKLSGHDLQDFGCTLKVIDGTLIHAMDISPYRQLHPISLITSAGRSIELPVVHYPRDGGGSSWRLLDLCYYFIDLVLGVCARPIRFLLLLSLCLLFLSAFVALLVASGYRAPIETGATLFHFLTWFHILIDIALGCTILLLTLGTSGNYFNRPGWVARSIRRRIMTPSSMKDLP